jgi:hypothetical protein
MIGGEFVKRKMRERYAGVRGPVMNQNPVDAQHA